MQCQAFSKVGNHDELVFEGEDWSMVLKKIKSAEKEKLCCFSHYRLRGVEHIPVELFQAFDGNGVQSMDFFYASPHRNIFYTDCIRVPPTEDSLSLYASVTHNRAQLYCEKISNNELEANTDQNILLEVQTLNGELLDLEVPRSLTISEIKHKMYEIKPIMHPYETGLVCDGRKLSDDHQLSFYTAGQHKLCLQQVFETISSAVANDTGFNDKTGEFNYRYIIINGEPYPVHLHWTGRQLVTNFIAAMKSKNPKNFMARKFRKTSVHAHKAYLDTEEERIKVEMAQLERSKSFIGQDVLQDVPAPTEVLSPELEAKLEQLVKREEELRRSPETQQLYQAAEMSDLTDWIEVTMKLRQQVLEEFGITGPDRFTLLEYAARKYGAFYVTQNLAARCLLEPGDDFKCDDIKIHHMTQHSIMPLNNALDTPKPFHFLIAGSIS